MTTIYTYRIRSVCGRVRRAAAHEAYCASPSDETFAALLESRRQAETEDLYSAWGVDQRMGWLYTSYGHDRHTLLLQFRARRVRDWEFDDLCPLSEMLDHVREAYPHIERMPAEELVDFPASATRWPSYLSQWETVESPLPPDLTPLDERVPPGTTAAVLAAYETGSRPPKIAGWGTVGTYRSALASCLLDSLPLALREARLECAERSLASARHGHLRVRQRLCFM